MGGNRHSGALTEDGPPNEVRARMETIRRRISEGYEKPSSSRVNTFVKEEYPCVDKAAAANRHVYGGRMHIRNIYLDGNEVLFDNTI